MNETYRVGHGEGSPQRFGERVRQESVMPQWLGGKVRRAEYLVEQWKEWIAEHSFELQCPWRGDDRKSKARCGAESEEITDSRSASQRNHGDHDESRDRKNRIGKFQC